MPTCELVEILAKPCTHMNCFAFNYTNYEGSPCQAGSEDTKHVAQRTRAFLLSNEYCCVGADYGGVRKEFFDLLCLELFEHSGLFKRFQNNPQGLVRTVIYACLVPRSFPLPVLDHLQYANTAYCKHSNSGGGNGLGTRLISL